MFRPDLILRLVPSILALLLWASPALSQSGGLMECSACQMAVGIAEYQASGGDSSMLNMSGPCAILEPADRQGCAASFEKYGARLLEAVRARRAEGMSVAEVCSQMGYCR